MEALQNFIHSKAGLITAIFLFAGLLIWLIVRAGVFAGLRKVLCDCALDHTTQKYTINNLARLCILAAFLFVFVSVHFQVQVNPFHITPVPLTEIEIGALLAFIIGAEWVKRTGKGTTTEPATEPEKKDLPEPPEPLENPDNKL